MLHLISSMVEAFVPLNRHWCDDTVFIALLVPLVHIVASRKKVVELIVNFVNPLNRLCG